MSKNHTDPGEPDITGGKCADIQELLFDFVSHELEPSRADLVRRHLGRCPACRAQAAELRETVMALRAAAATDSAIPQHVSPDRRERLVWSVMHPVRDWLRTHHVLVSLLVAVILLVALWAILRRVDAIPEEEPLVNPHEVIIGAGKP